MCVCCIYAEAYILHGGPQLPKQRCFGDDATKHGEVAWPLFSQRRLVRPYSLLSCFLQLQELRVPSGKHRQIAIYSEFSH